ncbi:thioredoxin [Spirochaetota bacterium]|nr:thioredoxin [Spirochaetota bacterium]
MSESQVLEVTETNFKETIEEGIALVDFWAEWCAPCREQGPIVSQLAEAVGDKYKIGKLDVDKHKTIAVDYEVSSIPTLIIFKDGQVVKRLVGLHPLEVLKSELAAV